MREEDDLLKGPTTTYLTSKCIYSVNSRLWIYWPQMPPRQVLETQRARDKNARTRKTDGNEIGQSAHAG